MKFRKNPVVIEAEQFHGVGWYEENEKPYPEGVCFCDAVEDGHAHLHTIHIGQTVKISVGDYVIPEPDGKHFYPCKPDIFEQTYESAEPVWKEADEG